MFLVFILILILAFPVKAMADKFSNQNNSLFSVFVVLIIDGAASTFGAGMLVSKGLLSSPDSPVVSVVTFVISAVIFKFLLSLPWSKSLLVSLGYKVAQFVLMFAILTVLGSAAS